VGSHTLSKFPFPEFTDDHETLQNRFNHPLPFLDVWSSQAFQDGSDARVPTTSAQASEVLQIRKPGQDWVRGYWDHNFLDAREVRFVLEDGFDHSSNGLVGVQDLQRV